MCHAPCRVKGAIANSRRLVLVCAIDFCLACQRRSPLARYHRARHISFGDQSEAMAL